MQGISCDPDHFGVIELMGAQQDRNLEADRRSLNLKGDTHVFFQLASRRRLDACHSDSIFRYGSHLGSPFSRGSLSFEGNMIGHLGFCFAPETAFQRIRDCRRISSMDRAPMIAILWLPDVLVRKRRHDGEKRSAFIRNLPLFFASDTPCN
jgi:hypothetical protein